MLLFRNRQKSHQTCLAVCFWGHQGKLNAFLSCFYLLLLTDKKTLLWSCVSFVELRLIWFLFSVPSHCEIIQTVASHYKDIFHSGIKMLRCFPRKFFFGKYSIHECLFMRKFMLYIWYLSNNRRFIKWDFPTGGGEISRDFIWIKISQAIRLKSNNSNY